MLRRMKIKASPNICLGAKKPNLPLPIKQSVNVDRVTSNSASLSKDGSIEKIEDIACEVENDYLEDNPQQSLIKDITIQKPKDLLRQVENVNLEENNPLYTLNEVKNINLEDNNPPYTLSEVKNVNLKDHNPQKTLSKVITLEKHKNLVCGIQNFIVEDNVEDNAHQPSGKNIITQELKDPAYNNQTKNLKDKMDQQILSEDVSMQMPNKDVNMQMINNAENNNLEENHQQKLRTNIEINNPKDSICKVGNVKTVDHNQQTLNKVINIQKLKDLSCQGKNINLKDCKQMLSKDNCKQNLKDGSFQVDAVTSEDNKKQTLKIGIIQQNANDRSFQVENINIKDNNKQNLSKDVSKQNVNEKSFQVENKNLEDNNPQPVLISDIDMQKPKDFSCKVEASNTDESNIQQTNKINLLRPVIKKKNYNILNNRRLHIKGQPIVNVNTSKRTNNANKATSVLENKQVISNTQIVDVESEKPKQPLLEETNKSMDNNKTKLNSSLMFSKVIKNNAKENFNENDIVLETSVSKKYFTPSNKNCIQLLENFEPHSPPKKVFNERKQIYKKKVSEGKLEPKQMTMFDLIFWNPSTNPMPGHEENERKRRNSMVNENVGVIAEIHQEENVEEQGLEDGENNGVIAATEDNDKKLSQESEEEDEDSCPVLAPQLKLGPDGELIIDEQSLTIKTTAAKNRDEFLKHAEVIEEANDTYQYGKWSKKRKRSTEWTRKETARFYKALSTVGTDFSLMETVFKWRSRAELKIKFKKEERVNRHLIDRALNDCTQFDFTIFDESDYDPEEDRKAAKEAEKAETKKKKEIERQNRQALKEEEKEKKKNQKIADKGRKRKLRDVFKKRQRKKYEGDRRNREPICASREDSNESTALSVIIDPQEVICEVVFSTNKMNRFNKNADSLMGEERNITISENLDQINEDSFSTPTPLNFQSYKSDIVANKCRNSINALHSLQLEAVVAPLPESSLISPIMNNSKPMFLKAASENDTFSDDITQILPSQCLDTVSDVLIKNSLSDINSIQFNQVAINSRDQYNVNEAEKMLEQAELSNDLVLKEQGQCLPLESSQNCSDLSIPNSGTDASSLPLQHETAVQSSLSMLLNGPQYTFPVTSVQKTAEGFQFVEMKTAKGLKRVPVPPFGPQITNVVVMANPDSEDPTEQIFHVYLVSPLSGSTEAPTNDYVPTSSAVNPV